MSSISLNKISTITSDIVKIQWFKKVGKEIEQHNKTKLDYKF